MPTYEYACTACQHEWEAEQSIKDDPLKECPACKQETAKRQISRGTGFILKGSGWYSDLYSGASNQKASAKVPSDTGGSSSSGGSSSGSSGGSSGSSSGSSSGGSSSGGSSSGGSSSGGSSSGASGASASSTSA